MLDDVNDGIARSVGMFGCALVSPLLFCPIQSKGKNFQQDGNIGNDAQKPDVAKPSGTNSR